jgi:hypothetical protein
MKHLFKALAVPALMAISAPAMAGDGKDIVKGAAIGAGGGAVAGAIIPGLGVGEGALIGGAGGAVVGALDKDGKHRRWHRDQYGRQYYVNKRGHRVYRH